MNVQRWNLDVDGRAHRVEASGSTRHHVRWFVDGQLVAERKAMEEKIRLRPRAEPDEWNEHQDGAVLVRFSMLEGSAPRHLLRAR